MIAGEFELIARHFAPLARGFPGAFGLLDDAAVIAPAPGHELVAKTDAIVGGVHFLDADPPELVARKALRVNLSDLAAKGAVPRAYLLDLMLPRTVTQEWIAGFARGLGHDQDAYGVHLIGGDTDSTPGPAAIAIMALGEVPAGRMIRRSGAHAGDTLFVTGTLGDATLGLRVLRGELPGMEPQAASFLIDRYRLPRPRAALGPRLVGLASAAIDVSDGLLADLGHLCEASALSAVVEAPLVPLSAAVRCVLDADAERIATVLTGGDDYEILFTAPPAAAGRLAELSAEHGVSITAIGRMQPPSAQGQSSVTVLDETGRPLALDRDGWTHFRAGPPRRTIDDDYRMTALAGSAGIPDEEGRPASSPGAGRAAGLGEKLAAVLWQLPSNFHRNLERLEGFARALRAWRRPRYAIEFRHSSWFDEEVADCLCAHRIAACQSDAADWLLWEAVITDFVYVRLHGRELTYASSYPEAALRAWARKVRRWTGEGRDVRAYFDNDACGDAPRNAARLLALVSGRR